MNTRYVIGELRDAESTMITFKERLRARRLFGAPRTTNFLIRFGRWRLRSNYPLFGASPEATGLKPKPWLHAQRHRGRTLRPAGWTILYYRPMYKQSKWPDDRTRCLPVREELRPGLLHYRLQPQVTPWRPRSDGRKYYPPRPKS